MLVLVREINLSVHCHPKKIYFSSHVKNPGDIFFFDVNEAQKLMYARSKFMYLITIFSDFTS